MKVATEILIQAPPQKIWETLSNFSQYPEWNRLVKSVSGNVAQDAAIALTLHFYGKNPEKKIAMVTGFSAPKYLSWSWKHSFGNWFLASEHVFRLKDKEDGRSIFFQEFYITGLGLKFRRRDMEQMIKLSLRKLNDDLQGRIEGPGG